MALIFSSLALLFTAAYAATLPNVIGTYDISPTPFTVDVDQSFITRTLNKVADAILPKDLGQPAFTDGPSYENATIVADYWLHNYSWTDTQRELNARFHHFSTTVSPRDSNYTEPTPLHFVHHRSNNSNAIPLLFVHGWPGSFLEVGRIIDSLTNPPNNSLPSFHVVAPSIPGFGFSPAPKKPGFGPKEVAQAFNSLMLQLNYTKYVVQGGDFGDFILHFQTSLYPDHVTAFLSNFWLAPVTSTDLQRFENKETTPDESIYISKAIEFRSSGAGYLILQGTSPLQIGYALTDSPLGFAMYIYQLMTLIQPDYFWTPQEIITWAMMYWIQGPYAGLRLYKEMARERIFNLSSTNAGLLGAYPFIKNTPIGITQRPADLGYRLPLDWAMRSANNVTKIYVHGDGGHFAAYATPSSLLCDIWDFFGNASLSSTDVFV